MKKFFIKFILGIIALFIVMQVFFLRIYFVPTRSMEPTYKIDSVIVATLFDYGVLNPYSPFSQTPLISSKADSGHILDSTARPERGDVIVFRNPLSPKTHLMKRVFAVGGDEVQFTCDGLYLKRPQDKEFIFDPYKEQFAGIHYDEDSATIFNALEYEYQKGLKETLNSTDTSEIASSKSNLDTPDCQNFFIWKLEKDTFFMVGDNRNHSFDSRFFGAVPYKFLVGKVRWQLFWHDLEKRLDQTL